MVVQAKVYACSYPYCVITPPNAHKRDLLKLLSLQVRAKLAEVEAVKRTRASARAEVQLRQRLLQVGQWV
jgi:hypothetical protein